MFHRATRFAATLAVVAIVTAAEAFAQSVDPAPAAPEGADVPAAVSTRQQLKDRATAVIAVFRSGDLAAAETAGDTLLADLRRELGDADVDTLKFMGDHGATKSELGRYAQSLALAEPAARGLRQALGERDYATLRARIGLSYTYYELGRHRDAVAELEDVFRLADTPELDGARRNAALSLVLNYTRLGRLGEAAALGERVLQEDLAAGRQETEYAFTNMENLAGVYLDLGRHDEAVELQRRATALFAKAFGQADYRTLGSQANVVQTLKAAGRLAEALDAARDLSARQGSPGERVDRNALVTRNIIASLLIDAGRLDEAQRELDAVIPLWEKAFGAHDPQGIDAHYFGARIAFERGQLGEAKRRYAAACAAFEVSGDAQEGAAQACPVRLAQAEWLSDERATALARLGRSLETFERRANDGLLTDVSRQSFFASRAGDFRRLLEWQLTLGRRDDAFAVSERMRARSLLQSIVFRHADESAALLPAEATARLADLKAAISRLEEQAARAEDADARLAAAAERDERYRALAAARAELQQRYPRYAALTSVSLVGSDEVRRMLAPGTAAVVFAEGETRLYAFVLSARAPMQVVDLGEHATITTQVLAWRALLANDPSQRVWRSTAGEWRVAEFRPGAQWQPVTDPALLARALGARVLQPLMARLRNQPNWLIVPDRALSQVPLEALVVDGRHVVENHAVRYIQSLSVWATLKRRTDRAAQGLLSVGDPDYATERAQGAARPQVAAFDTGIFLRGMVLDRTATRRAYDRLGVDWSALPATRDEVEAVTRAFAGRTVVKLLGAEASEQELQRLNGARSLRGFRYLHFATHGYLSLDAPALSAIVLAQTRTSDLADGYITAAEWPAYELDSELIVLSGCETGRGRSVEGEGVMGLPYALLVAGNRNAVLTLWKVADKPSAAFVGRFMRRVAAGAGIADALARTKREFLRDRALAHPMHWAGFVHYGE